MAKDVNAKFRKYRSKNLAKLAQKARVYRSTKRSSYLQAKEKYKAKAAPALKERYRGDRLKVIAAYGGACACCGEANICFLSIDHVNNDGYLHRRSKKSGNCSSGYKGGGYNIYTWLRRQEYPKDGRFQILCYNCNCSKTRDPVGHRAIHPYAHMIDGLGPNLEMLPTRKSSGKPHPTLWD